jgi:hypothetical protein
VRFKTLSASQNPQRGYYKKIQRWRSYNITLATILLLKNKFNVRRVKNKFKVYIESRNCQTQACVLSTAQEQLHCITNILRDLILVEVFLKKFRLKRAPPHLTEVLHKKSFGTTHVRIKKY